MSVLRDKAGKIKGFQQAQFYAHAPGVDSSIQFDPQGRGILFTSIYPNHQILQFHPMSTVPDYTLNLTTEAPEVDPKIGSLVFVPQGKNINTHIHTHSLLSLSLSLTHSLTYIHQATPERVRSG